MRDVRSKPRESVYAHVKRLKDLNADNEFDELMLQKRRKSLALCPKCYEEAKLKSLEL